ncbi:MAG: hypothetical protein K0U68_11840, partial [Gammaproteobacteria bacterium]|nr:hypothetical protein [Gammaproteobacteria bacterium]
IQGIDDNNPDNKDWHYPIFISWPSNPVGTWAEQTFLVREGRKTSLLLGAISSPFVILSNIFRGLGKYPITVWYQLVNEKDWASSQLFPNLLSQSWKDSKKNYCNLNNTSNGDVCDRLIWQTHSEFDQKNLRLNYSQYHSELSDSIKKASLEAVTFPIRMTLGTVWHSSIAVSAWDNMKRRTLNAFFPTHDFDSREHNSNPQHADEWFSGGDFFQHLLDSIQADYEQPDHPYQYEITLVGHSMGTIVLNHALKIYRQQWQDTGTLKHIVYMAAAASIDDSLDALVPLLVPSNPQNTPPGFYNLVLNRVAEVSETHAFGIVPSGSLLVSIDQHYETPEHPMKRTLGSEVNVLSALKAITSRLQGAKSPIVFKAFDRYPDSVPSIHGGFNDLEFWKQSVWNPSTQTDIPLEKESIKHFNAYPERVD